MRRIKTEVRNKSVTETVIRYQAVLCDFWAVDTRISKKERVEVYNHEILTINVKERIEILQKSNDLSFIYM